MRVLTLRTESDRFLELSNGLVDATLEHQETTKVDVHHLRIRANASELLELLLGFVQAACFHQSHGKKLAGVPKGRIAGDRATKFDHRLLHLPCAAEHASEAVMVDCGASIHRHGLLRQFEGFGSVTGQRERYGQ